MSRSVFCTWLMSSEFASLQVSLQLFFSLCNLLKKSSHLSCRLWVTQILLTASLQYHLTQSSILCISYKLALSNLNTSLKAFFKMLPSHFSIKALHVAMPSALTLNKTFLFTLQLQGPGRQQFRDLPALFLIDSETFQWTLHGRPCFGWGGGCVSSVDLHLALIGLIFYRGRSKQLQT